MAAVTYMADYLKGYVERCKKRSDTFAHVSVTFKNPHGWDGDGDPIMSRSFHIVGVARDGIRVVRLNYGYMGAMSIYSPDARTVIIPMNDIAEVELCNDAPFTLRGSSR